MQERTLISHSQGGRQEQVFIDVTSMVSCCIASLSSLILFVLNPFPEKGTQKRRTFQMKARGQQAGRNPEENDRALAVVTVCSGERNTVEPSHPRH